MKRTRTHEVPALDACHTTHEAGGGERFQRSLVPTRSATYRQCASAAGGNHSAGSLSALLRLERPVTAIRLAGASWSLA